MHCVRQRVVIICSSTAFYSLLKYWSKVKVVFINQYMIGCVANHFCFPHNAEPILHATFSNFVNFYKLYQLIVPNMVRLFEKAFRKNQIVKKITGEPSGKLFVYWLFHRVNFTNSHCPIDFFRYY